MRLSFIAALAASVLACSAYLPTATIAATAETLAQQAAAPPSAGQNQSSVASKQSVPSIAASDPQVKSALAATDVAKATALAGKSATVQATVTRTYSPASNAIVILDLAKDYRAAITAVAFPANYAKLPDLQKLVGQHLLLTGPITVYRGKPELVLSSAGQIHVIK